MAGTWVGYENNLNSYFHFCQYFSLEPFPLSERVSILFSQFLADSKLQSKTIKGRLSSLNSLGSIYRFPLLDKQFFGVNLLLRGIEKINCRVKKQAPPITPEILILVDSVIDFHSPFKITMWNLFLTCFFLMLRKSNVTPASPVLDENFLRRKDFKRRINGCFVPVHSTKTL